MDIMNLQAFVSVAENTSFSAAAEQLHLTQPAISKRISSLEANLTTRLFDRIGHRVILTESGTALLPRARSILAQLEDSRRMISNLSGHVGGRLSVGTSHHIGLHRLPPVLRSYTSAYPEVELDLHFMDSEQACHAVEHGDLEIGIVTLPSQAHEKLDLIRIWDDPLVIVSAHDHALTAVARPDIKQLADYPAILPGTGTFTREILEQAFDKLGVHLKTSLSTNYLETIKMMVSIGLGWSVLPRTMVDKELCVLDIKSLKMQRNLGVVMRTDRTLSNAAHKLIEQLERLKNK